MAWSSAGNNLYDGLIRRDENLKLQPSLATRWEVSDDGLNIRFHLREGVTFHNGEPFNADAVKFTFDRLLGEEGAKGPQRSNYTSIKSVEVIDPNTVDFHLNYPDPVLLTKLAGYGAMIVPPKYIQEKGDEHFNTHPVGTGPFKFKAYTQGDKLELVANPDYFDGAPKLEKLTYRFIREDATRIAELQAGRIDIIHDLPSNTIPVVQKTAGVKVVAVDGPSITSLQFNTKNGITKDVRVRKALSMAVDKKMLIDAFLSGYGTPINSIQSPLSYGYDTDLKDYPYDPAAAQKLLKEAGVPQGAKVTIDYRASHSNFAEIAQALTAFFNQIGLQAELRPYEDAIYLDDIVPNGKTNEMFQFSWGGWTFDFDNTAYLVYHNGEKWNPYGTSEAINQLLEKQRLTTNPEERLTILKQISKVAHDEVYHLPLYASKTVYAVSDKVKNFVPAPDSRVRYLTTDTE